jgi:hypothetical protein
LLAALAGEKAEQAKEPPSSSDSDWVHSLVAQIEEGLSSYRQQVHFENEAEVEWLQCTVYELQTTFLCTTAEAPIISFMGPAVRLQLLNLLAEHFIGPASSRVATTSPGRAAFRLLSFGCHPSDYPYSRARRPAESNMRPAELPIHKHEQGHTTEIANLEKCILAQVDGEEDILCRSISRHCATASEGTSLFVTLTRACSCALAEVRLVFQDTYE